MNEVAEKQEPSNIYQNLGTAEMVALAGQFSENIKKFEMSDTVANAEPRG